MILARIAGVLVMFLVALIDLLDSAALVLCGLTEIARLT